MPSAPPAISSRLPFHSTEARKATSESTWVTVLHAIISGTASVGGRTCRSTAPATAENAKPTRLDTTAPAKMPALTKTRENGSTKLTSFSFCDPHRRAREPRSSEKDSALGKPRSLDLQHALF